MTRDEFETVKELLASAARYAEPSHRRLDQIARQQQVNVEAIANLGEKLDRLSIKIDQLTESQYRTQAQLDQLSLRVTQLSERVDTFVSTAQFYFTRHGESIEQLKGISERLEGLLTYLIRKDQQG